MSRTERHKRLRLLLKQLNRQRKRQAMKIDILCNDLISAQRAFLLRLHGISFAAEFYKSLLGSADLADLLARASRAIRQELPGTSVTFFLRQPEGCDLRAFENDETSLPEDQRPEDYFNSELAGSICKSNRPCTLDDMFGMGLEGDLQVLRRFSMSTLPLNDLGRPLGFVLLYRRAPQTLTKQELQRVGPLMCGLSQAIRSERAPLHSGR